jgi:hypothetical protein
LWGFTYANATGGEDYVPAKDEKQYRQRQAENGTTLISFKRKSVLARNIADTVDTNNATDKTAVNPYISYFEVFRFLYPPRMC